MNTQILPAGQLRQIQKKIISNDPDFLELNLFVSSNVNCRDALRSVLTVDEFIIFMDNVAFNKYLKRLRVNFYNYKDEEFSELDKLKMSTAFALALERNSSLRYLDLSSSTIDLKCLNTLLNALQHSRIKLLNLCSIDIGDVGVFQLVEALLPNKYLRKLYLCCCNIGQRGDALIRELMKNKRALKVRWDQLPAPR